ncbi:zf-TFIIB domain-containing protein [Acidobacteriota bacterium]
MVFTCPACGVRFDCGKLKPGEFYKCSCGEIIPIERITPRNPRVLYCPACGGPLQKESTTCEYCGGSVSIAEKNLDSLCPECFTRLPNRARHCFNCGARANPLKVPTDGTGCKCPRCDVELTGMRIASFNILECKTCGGLWLTEQTFVEICRDRKEHATLSKSLYQTVSHKNKDNPSQVVYLKCPECGKLMNRKSFAKRSGVIVDRCRDHGIWLDCQELEQILKFIDSGGMEHAKRLKQEEQNVRVPRAPRSYFKVSRYDQVAFAKDKTFSSPKDTILGEIADLFD